MINSRRDLAAGGCASGGLDDDGRRLAQMSQSQRHQQIRIAQKRRVDQRLVFTYHMALGFNQTR